VRDAREVHVLEKVGSSPTRHSFYSRADLCFHALRTGFEARDWVFGGCVAEERRVCVSLLARHLNRRR
jgi:hypothetical protein